ncbi:MAG: DUF4178 domain-containing protein [Bryobacterales bacterium]|nr:DUF4178 domain-containing protein [Bryobacterales bacterium]
MLDTTTPSLQVIQKFQAKERYQPYIPLGTRGKLRGDLYEVIGFQVRELVVDAVAYQWREYLLFNPYKGFRYLTEYNGHWNDVTVLRTQPDVNTMGMRPTAKHLGETYQHFQHYDARTVYVMGEFPWRVRVGEMARCDDFIHPPRLLSREASENETNWSVGEYTTGEEIWKSFQLKGSPPPAIGVFANQPSPGAGSVAQAWSRFIVWTFILLFIQVVWATALHSKRTVFQQRYSFSQGTTPGGENSFVTDVFELKGRPSTLNVQVATDLSNEWAFFQLALINADSGAAYDFSRQVSYYSGRDSDGSWSEGSARDSVTLPHVAPGHYYLRVEPEMDTAPATAPRSVRYEIKVVHDVTTWVYFFIGFLLLLVPPIWTTLRSGSFEMKRWAESDYGTSTSSPSSGDDE